MNANELADKLEKPMVDNPDCPNFSRTRGFMEQVVAMLRQQQAEIERLIGAEPITYGMLTVCKNCGQQNPYFEKAQEK